MPGLKFLTVEQVQQLIELATTSATSGANRVGTVANVDDRVRQLTADQQSELYGLYLLGRDRVTKTKDLDHLTDQARAFSMRMESFPSRKLLASKLRKGLEKLGAKAGT